MEFFSVATASGKSTYTGKGTISSVLYQGVTLKIVVARKSALNENLTATVYIRFPPGQAAPLTVGTQIDVRVIDAASSDNPDNRAIVLRDGNGQLLLAAETAQNGRLLTNADTAPFTVTFEEKTIGCRLESCGKLLFSKTRFESASGAVLLDPGKGADQVVLGAGSYHLLNVNNGRYGTTTCKPSKLQPYAVWQAKAP
jgi:hypothetical protein